MQEKYAPIKTDCPMENERIRIRRLNAANDANILGAETDTVQMARTACFVCTRGGGKILLNGMEHTVESGSLIVYFSYSVLHIISKTHDLEGILISCNLETIQPLLYKVSDFNSLFLIRKHPYTKLKEWQVKMITDYIELFSGILRHIKTEEQARLEAQIQPIRETMRQQIDLLASSLMLGIVSCFTNSPLKTVSHSRKDDVLQKFITMLYHSYKTEHDVKYYATAQCLTSRYFSAIIKEKSGKAPSEWIMAALLGESKRMLNSTSKTIKEISVELHFPNQSYFGKWFKNLVGCSPLEYKKGKKGTELPSAEYAAIVGLHPNRKKD